MNYGRSFSFMFEDRDWVVKIVLGGVFMLLSCILVGIPFLYGYVLEVIRNVAEGRDTPLPSWDNLGEKFVQGLIIVVILIIVAIPLILSSCAAGFLNAILADTRGDGARALMLLVVALAWLFFALYTLVYALFLPAFMIRYAMTRDFGATLNIRSAWSIITANFGNYILVLIVAALASLLGSLGTIACVIGVFLTYFWAYLLQGHLFGQYYRAFVSPAGGVSPQAAA